MEWSNSSTFLNTGYRLSFYNETEDLPTATK